MAKPRWYVVWWSNGSSTAFRDPLAAQMLADSMRQPVVGRDDLPVHKVPAPKPHPPALAAR